MERLQTYYYISKYVGQKEEREREKNSMITHQNFHHVYPPALKSSPLERAAGAAV